MEKTVISTEMIQHLNTSEDMVVQYLDMAVRNVMTTMVGTDLSPSRIVATQTRFEHSATAMVGYAGIYSGLVSISFPQRLALIFASNMHDTEITDCNDEVHDALGEIANMVGGSFKQHFIVDGREAHLSTPSVISGDKYFITAGAVSRTLTLLFDSNGEHFLVNVFLEAAR
jgi:chemotaxis protein CheX